MENKVTGNTGILLIAHGAVAYEMLNALEFITGKQPSFRAMALDHALEIDKARQVMMEAIDEMMGEGGVLVLTDLFGGSPSNIAMSIIDERPIEIVAGVNMPMLIQAVTMEDDISLREKAERLRDYGKNNIFVASEVLGEKKKPV